MTVNTNLRGINTYRNLKCISISKAKSVMRLASGLRINSAADDAAGLAISEKMRAQIRGLDQASRNIEDAVNMFTTAEGALAEIGNMLQRIRELAVQACNDTNTPQDREKINNEISELSQEINALSERTEFNTKELIDVQASSLTRISGGRSSAVSLSGNAAARTQLQNAFFSANPNSPFIQINISNSSGYNYVLAVNIGYAVTQIDPGFESFVKNDMYESDGSVTALNLQRFADTLQAGIREEFRLNEPWLPGGDSGSASVTVDCDSDGNLIFGFSDSRYKIYNVMSVTNNPPANANDFGTQFFLGMLGDAALGNPGAETIEYIKGGDKELTHFEFWIQTGANSGQGALFEWDSVAAGASFSVLSVQEATQTLKAADAALESVNSLRSRFGAYINRLQASKRSVDISAENLTAAESRIRDADIAKEIMNLTKQTVLEQVAVLMLAQANQSAQSVLQLLRA